MKISGVRRDREESKWAGSRQTSHPEKRDVEVIIAFASSHILNYSRQKAILKG
jgi:hypothetical protein